MSPARRPLPEGREAMEADVREVIREIEAAGAPVTAGRIREAYGGEAQGSWQPHGDPERPEVPPDSLDPLLEEVLRDLAIDGATSGPEPLPVPVLPPVPEPERGRVDSPELPLLDIASGPMVAIVDKPTVALLSTVVERQPNSFLPERTEWRVRVTAHDPAQSFEVAVGAEHIDGTGRVDLHAVRDLLAARGVHVEPTHRWHRSSLAVSEFRLDRIPAPGDSPWVSSPSFSTRRPIVQVRPTEIRSAIRPQVHGWEYTIDTGGAEGIRRGVVADRHVTELGELNLMAFAEELRAEGIAVAEPAEHLLVPESLSHSRHAMWSDEGSHEVGAWQVLPGTSFIGEPPPLRELPIDESSGGGKLKWVVGGVGGMLLAVVAVPLLMNADDGPAAPVPAAVVEPEIDASEATDPPVATDQDAAPVPSVDAGAPLSIADPPPTYREPDLGFDAAPADQRARLEGSVWGTSVWTEVDVTAKPQGNFLGSPPPTVAPEGYEFVVEFVIHAECADETAPETCAFSIDRGADRISLGLEGLSLTGAGDDITDGCGGQSGVEYQISDLTVVDGRLVPTYLTGRRFFREMCPGWDRFLDIEHNGRYVDRPSSTP